MLQSFNIINRDSGHSDRNFNEFSLSQGEVENEKQMTGKLHNGPAQLFTKRLLEPLNDTIKSESNGCVPGLVKY